MALIDSANAIKHVLSILDSDNSLFGIQMLSYKRNRYVSIFRKGENFLIEEKGYIEQELLTDFKHLTRLLKSIIKREFPRSRKIRVIKLENNTGTRQDLKRL